MRWTGVVAGAACVVALHAAAGAAVKAPSGAPPKVAQVMLGIKHRVFPSFGQKVTVKMQERFPVGDTDYSAQIVQFLPHFDYDIKRRRAVSRSNELRNPAFRVVVREKGVPKDTTWVFLDAPPHFARTSMLAFQVLRIDFAGRAPMFADTTTARGDAR